MVRTHCKVLHVGIYPNPSFGPFARWIVDYVDSHTLCGLDPGPKDVAWWIDWCSSLEHCIHNSINKPTSLVLIVPPPPPLRPCASYSGCRDRDNCVPNFDCVRNVVRPHKTWVCRVAYFPKGMKLSELEDLKYFANSDSHSSFDSDSDSGTDTDDDDPISESSSSDDSGDSDDEPTEDVWAVGNGPCL